MSESVSIQLDGRTFVIGYAPASEALTAAAIYANVFAPMVDGVRRARDQGSKVPSQRLAGIAEVMAQPGLAQQARALCVIFAKCTQVVDEQGRSLSLADPNSVGPVAMAVFDRIFAGKIASLWKWLDAAIEHNLSDFLVELRARAAELAPEVFGSKSPESSATNGSSGNSSSRIASA